MLRRCACIFTLLLALVACTTKDRHYAVDRSQYPVKGIDVSAHNGYIDFDQVRADSVEFVYIKATEGSDFCDAMYARNFVNAAKAGLKTGAYHFFRFKTPGHIQAYHFLNTIGHTRPDLPLAIDVEDWQNDADVPDAEVVDQLRSMVDVLTNAGYPVIIYTNADGYKKYMQDNLDDVPVWICTFKGEPSLPNWRLWQHSHRGTVRGVSGHVDLNTYNGDRAAFAAWLQQ